MRAFSSLEDRQPLSVLTWQQKRERKISLLIRVLWGLTLMTSSKSNYLPRPNLKIPSHWGLGVNA
jgi:hypothetical protein